MLYTNLKMNKMKKNIINILLLTTILFVGCKKNDARYPFSVDLVRIPYVNTTIDATGSAAIDLTNLALFNGKYSINLLYPNDIKPDKVDVVVRKNNSNAVVKVLHAGVTSFPTAFTVSAAELSTAFGTAIKLGDNYEIGTDIYVGDKKYEAFPAAGGIAYGGTGQANQPGFSPSIIYSAICAYDPNIYVGNFKATDAFGDADGAIIVLTKVDNTHFSFIYPSAVNGTPITVTVNALNNTVTIPLTTIGTAWSPAYGYPNTATYANPSVNSATGTVAPCDKTVTLKIQWGTNAGALQFGGGPYTLLLTKQ
jgi:hypothetical protein